MSKEIEQLNLQSEYSLTTRKSQELNAKIHKELKGIPVERWNKSHYWFYEKTFDCGKIIAYHLPNYWTEMRHALALMIDTKMTLFAPLADTLELGEEFIASIEGTSIYGKDKIASRAICKAWAQFKGIEL